MVLHQFSSVLNMGWIIMIVQAYIYRNFTCLVKKVNISQNDYFPLGVFGIKRLPRIINFTNTGATMEPSVVLDVSRRGDHPGKNLNWKIINIGEDKFEKHGQFEPSYVINDVDNNYWNSILEWKKMKRRGLQWDWSWLGSCSVKTHGGSVGGRYRFGDDEMHGEPWWIMVKVNGYTFIQKNNFCQLAPNALNRGLPLPVSREPIPNRLLGVNTPTRSCATLNFRFQVGISTLHNLLNLRRYWTGIVGKWFIGWLLVSTNTWYKKILEKKIYIFFNLVNFTWIMESST